MYILQDRFELSLIAVIHRFIHDGDVSVRMVDSCILALWKNRKTIHDPIDFLIDEATRDVKTYLLSTPQKLDKTPQWFRMQQVFGDQWDSMNLDNKNELKKFFR